MPAKSMIERFHAAHRVSTPIAAIRTTDNTDAIRRLALSMNGSLPHLWDWDIISGAKAFSEPAHDFGGDGIGALDPIAFLTWAQDVPNRSILFMHNAQMFLTDPMVKQAIWNLRNPYELSGRMLVLLGADFILPPELANDILVLDDPLPDEEERMRMARTLWDGYRKKHQEMPEWTEESLRRAAQAGRGLSGFAYRQAVSENLAPEGLHIPGVSERAMGMVEEMGGLRFHRGKETFADIGGLEPVVNYFTRLENGPDAPSCYVWIDEIN